MTVKRVKVFGERNTGTNFVENILLDNFDFGVCPGNFPRPLQGAWNLIYRTLPYHTAWHIVEGQRDALHSAFFNKYAGWKHARTPNLPKGRNAYPPSLGFIAVVKDPYAWLLSMHRRPYQGTRHTFKKQMSFSDFIRAPWKTVAREHTLEEYENPVEMWNDKVSSYAALHQYGPTIIMAYEDLIGDPEGFVRRVSNEFGSPLPTDLRIRSGSTKKDDSRTTADIVLHYKSREWASKIEFSDREFINDRVDIEMMKQFGYPLLQDYESQLPGAL